MYSDAIAISLLCATGLAAGFLVHAYRTRRRPHLLAWTAGWCLLFGRYLVMALEPWFGAPGWMLTLEPLLLAAAALTFFYAAEVYSGARTRSTELLIAASVFLVWSGAYGFDKTRIGPQIGIAAVFLGVAWLFWEQGRPQQARAEKLLSLVFFLWAPVPVVEMLLGHSGSAARWDAEALAYVPELLFAVVVAAAVFESEKRSIEQDLVALSNLNLANVNFGGGDAEQTLARALERMLGVVHFPAAAVFLRCDGAHGSSSAASAGLDASFCQRVQEATVDDHFGRLVATLGGVAVFHLEREASWESFRDDEAFVQLRQQAMEQGLRTVVGIALEANDRTSGVLLLGTPESRPVSYAERRFLAAVSQQIGTAIANSYLMQQNLRRFEELRALSEVGRALGGMIDRDALLERVFTEMQRLLGVTSFYIALCDDAENQVCFELEVVDGVRLPKRTRPRANYLTEAILRTRQPVLIRENFQEEARKLGAEPARELGSFCGVPLVAYDRVIGVMAVRELEERRFDESHMETMRVLAGAAAIAIENARLFREEQTKSRHLMLLNSISRSAITTLNPDEMLSNIAEQLEQGLAFDHIGIGLLDYARKEVVIQAEAGKRLGALGRRLGLGESHVGRVARTGQMSAAGDLAGAGCGEPILDDSVSGIALPILYAEQLHGVLYVETSEPKEFSEEEQLFLRTLADLISGALHNALTFQKAQEQAITDGLTGVKTHRFLMEALGAEWKRSARASRSFSLLLMDLDRFKFVNDFYGHLEGDLVLKRVGHILEEHCRRSDVVARYGGDEFVILMPETNIEQGRQIAHNLRSWISGDLLLREKRVTASIGIASFPVHGATPQELIQVADASMYLSKNQGGNAVSCAERYDPEETKKWKRSVLEAYLGVALKRMPNTGPEAFEDICSRIAQFAQSVAPAESAEEGLPQASPVQSRAAVMETVIELALVIDSRDHFTQGHSQKVSVHAARMATRLGLNEEEVEEIRVGGILHDIGKVGIPEDILNKNGPLNPEEWEVMKAHARYGDEILSPLSAMARIRGMVRHHHEMFDGSGYPDGLAGEKIPLGARIIAVADAYDTITSDRVYKKARMVSAACVELERCAGTQFDPELVRVFVEVLQEPNERASESGEETLREAAG